MSWQRSDNQAMQPRQPLNYNIIFPVTLEQHNHIVAIDNGITLYRSQIAEFQTALHALIQQPPIQQPIQQPPDNTDN